MSARWNITALLAPISPEAPCGKSLEDTDDLGLLDAYQIFGQTSLEPVERKKGDPVPKETRKSKADRPPNWQEIGDLAFGILGKSKDLRALTYLAAAAVRVDGPQALTDALSVASKWLGEYWSKVYPLVDEDAVFRRNALNGFADRLAVIDGLRRAPLVTSRVHGKFALKDLEGGAVPAAPDESGATPDDARVSAAFAELPIADLTALQASAAEGLAALGAIEEMTRRESGIEAAPSFESLVSEFRKLDSVLRERISLHPDGPKQTEGVAAGTNADGSVAVGAIRSRQDAIRALEAVAEFFRRNEPSSPLPLIVDRAKRLVAKDFLEVLADVAPEALPSARAAGGIRE